MNDVLAQQLTLEDAYVMHTYARSSLLFERGQGMYLYDADGDEYLDFLAGIAVCPLGHADPVVTQAVQSQAAQVMATSNYFYAANRGEVARLISDAAGAGYTWKSFFANSGAEANECAMKVARRWGIEKRGASCQTIVVLKGSFHGRTMQTLAATAQDWLQDPFRPMPGSFVAVERNDASALEAAMSADVCAIMLEPIQGESGVWPMEDAYLREVRRIADAYECLVIFDEVQTGLYRCGAPLCFQTTQDSAVVPDIFTLAKGIANGVPCGVCVARGDAAEILTPGQQGSTFGGGHLAMAAARATLEQLRDRELHVHAREVGAYLRTRLLEVPYIHDVRGKGLMLGAALVGVDAHELVDALLQKHIVANACGADTLRLLPPLIIEPVHVDALVDALCAI